MATDLHDETFFGGTTDDPSLVTVTNKLLNANQEDVKERKSTSASMSPKPGRKTTPKPKLPKNENSGLVKAETKKAGRTSKAKREPLKVLNNKEKATDVAPKKKNEVKNNAKSDPPQRKSLRVVDKGMPKIVVFQDHTGKAKAQKKPVQKSVKDTSSGAATRRSLPEGRKTQTLEVSRGGKARHTLDSIPRTPKKSPKSAEKSPAKGKVENLKNTEPEANESLAKLEKIFPNVDPDFLKSQLAKFKGSLQDTTQFLINKEKENDLPTKDDYLKMLRVEEIQAMFKQNFSVEEFLSMFPDPWSHFSRKETQRSATYVKSSLHYLKSKHKKHYLQAIQEALAKNENCLYLADKALSRKNRFLKMRATNRSKCECDASRPTAFDVHFMHEVVFIENEKEIKLHLKKVEMARHKKFKEAEKAETLLECLSCNNLSLLQDDTVNCPAHHVFCKDCLIKYVKIETEKNDFKFKCLVKCEEAFSVETLKSALTPHTLGSIIERNQKETIKPEGIENLVSCPFCYNIFMAPDETKDLACLNPTCMMESCRKCKRTSHMPWKCNEANVITEAPLEVEEEKQTKEEEQDGEDEQNENDSETDLSLALLYFSNKNPQIRVQTHQDPVTPSPLNFQQPSSSNNHNKETYNNINLWKFQPSFEGTRTPSEGGRDAPKEANKEELKPKAECKRRSDIYIIDILNGLINECLKPIYKY